MGSKKDLDTIRSILFGEAIEQVQERFAHLEDKIESLQIRLQEAQEEITALQTENELLKDHLKRQSDRIDTYAESFDHELSKVRHHFSDALKRQNVELTMAIKKHYSSLESTKVSNASLAKMFHELSQKLDHQKNDTAINDGYRKK